MSNLDTGKHIRSGKLGYFSVLFNYSQIYVLSVLKSVPSELFSVKFRLLRF